MGSLQEALAKLLRTKEETPEEKEERAKKGKEMAEKMSKPLPDTVFPHEALKKKKAQQEQMDKDTGG